jgi:hypothetical protein
MQKTISVRREDPLTTTYPCATYGCENRASFVETTTLPVGFYGACVDCASRRGLTVTQGQRYRLTCSRTNGSMTNSRFSDLRAAFAWLDALRAAGTVRRAWITDRQSAFFQPSPTGLGLGRLTSIIYSR